jgi:hypothetical protein
VLRKAAVGGSLGLIFLSITSAEEANSAHQGNASSRPAA